MATNRLDLKYAKRGLTFFTEMQQVKSSIQEHRVEHLINDRSQFEERDHLEISRGKGYALFEDLRRQDRVISIEALSEKFSAMGVQDNAFQAKILSVVLQNRLALPFGMANIILAVAAGEEAPQVVVNNDNMKVNVEVVSPDEVKLHVKLNLRDYQADEDALATHTVISITPDSLELNHLFVEQLSQSETATRTFDNFKANQQNIIERIITFIRHLFGFKDELVLDRSSPVATTMRG